ncbi:hypothetical protein OROGR_024731 [Orobanche gracilis]
MYLSKFGMRECSSTSVLVVDAEVDSMGGVGIANKTSPQKASIEKVQAKLWREYRVRDQHKKELEFLEKGGDPLDLKLWNGALVSVRSTLTDQHRNQFVTNEAKGIFPFTASPHGDSVESSGKPGTTREPNSADNLMLFDVEHEFCDGGRSFSHPSRSEVAPSKQSLKVDGSKKTQEHGNSASLNLPRKAYKRRYRSRLNGDVSRSSSSRGCPGSSLSSHHGLMSVSDAENQNISLNRISEPTSIMDDTLSKTAFTNDLDDIVLDNKGVSVDATSDAIVSKNPLDEQFNQNSPSAVSEAPNEIISNGAAAIQALREKTSAGIECQQSVTATKVENHSRSCQMNGFSRHKCDNMTNDAHNSNGSCGIKVLDSELSCTHASLSIDVNNDRETCTGVSYVDPNGNLQNQPSHDGNPVTESDKCVRENKDEGVNSTIVNKENAACQSQQDHCLPHQPGKEMNQSESGLENKVKVQALVEGLEARGGAQLEPRRKLTDPSVDNHGVQNEISYDVKHQDSVKVSNADLPEAGSSIEVSTVPIEAQISSGSESKLAREIGEDSILKEAQVIEAKQQRIAELSIMTSPMEIFQKSHWDYVLQEMAWLANDFSQERIWKLAAASQVAYQFSVTYRLRKRGTRSEMDAKTVAHTLAKAVMEFWRSVHYQDTSNELEQQRQKSGTLSVRAYAVRLLKCIKPNIYLDQAEVPLTPDRIYDLGIVDLAWEDNLTEENLFYTVPHGAGEAYRKSVESHVAHYEVSAQSMKQEVMGSTPAGGQKLETASLPLKMRSTVQEEVDTSLFDAAADVEYRGNVYYEDEGETSTYSTTLAFEGSNSSRYGEKKRKHSTHAYGPRTYELGSDLLPIQCAENKVLTQQSALLAKRPGSTLNVSVPTKRMRTAARRVVIPFTAGAPGCIQLPNKTDASSCDTDSFQDDPGLFFQNSLEVESAGEFANQLPFTSVEVSTRPKKKKPKHLNAGYEQGWQVNSSFQNEQFQRDPMKKRSESHLLGSNGNSGLLDQPMMKKPKLMRQSQDNPFDNILPRDGSAPSPAASQMSNMSNPNKFIKMLGGRDRGRKAKALKIPAGQPGSGGPWSLFEDQALVVLVHDLGPNWELVSDAINSTLHFKCIYWKAKKCKERHNLLMDGTSGDGCSQPYPSTLPGIPKGSARQLFQCLQGPMEEDTLKSHFEKIILIGQKPYSRKTQRPLDLCDVSVSSPDLLSLGYQGPDSSGLAIPNQGTVNPMLPASAARFALQRSTNMTIGNHFSSLPDTLNRSARDGRYAGPRPGSLSADEQQRLHQYNRRNISQPNISAPTDRGGCMVPCGNGMGMMGGVSRSLPMVRPGFQGIPPSLVNPGGVVSSVMSLANMHAGRGSSGLKSRENLHMMRPGLNQDTQRQTTIPDLQKPWTSQGPTPHFSGLNSPLPNQTPQPVSSYPLHQPPTRPISPQPTQILGPHHPHFQAPSLKHAPNPQQQAYDIRLAKERQSQHRLLQQQKQQQLASSSSSNHTMPQQPQLHISPQTSSPPTQGGIIRKAPDGLTSQTVKQRQRQQNQLNRQHPQQRQQAKVVKGVGRGNTSGAFLLSGASTNPVQYVALQSTSNQSQSSKNIKLICEPDNSSQLGNQNQPVIQRAAQLNSDPANNSQVGRCDTGQRPPNSSAENILPRVSNNAKNTAVLVVPQATSTNLPHIRQDVSSQQSRSQVHKPQERVPPLHSQRQAQVLQAGNGHLNGKSSEPRLE